MPPFLKIPSYSVVARSATLSAAPLCPPKKDKNVNILGNPALTHLLKIRVKVTNKKYKRRDTLFLVLPYVFSFVVTYNVIVERAQRTAGSTSVFFQLFGCPIVIVV